jgi:hypothetical protein
MATPSARTSNRCSLLESSQRSVPKRLSFNGTAGASGGRAFAQSIDIGSRKPSTSALNVREPLLAGTR